MHAELPALRRVQKQNGMLTQRTRCEIVQQVTIENFALTIDSTHCWTSKGLHVLGSERWSVHVSVFQEPMHICT